MMPHRLPARILYRKCLGTALLLLAAVALFASARSAWSAEFTDAAGRHVMLPDRIDRILPAERNAEVLVYVLAPDKLAGLSRERLLKRPGHLPVLAWGPRSSPASMGQTARRVRADLIVDAGTVTPERAAFADQVQRLTGIPYILVDDSFARMPTMLRSLGAILQVADRAGDLGLYAEHAIAALRGRLLIRPADTRPHVYYALGADGLVTALPGSPADEAIDEAGAINVAASLGRGGDARVSYAQLAGWDPEIIIAQNRGFYAAVRHSPAWRRLSAVRHDRVYLEPESPFGWIDDPAGVNRLIGLYWLSSLLYPNMLQEDLRTTTCDFYDKFYRVKLTNAQVEALVAPAGAPKPELPRPIGGSLVGLGAAPPSSLSYGTQAGTATSGAPSAMPGAMIEGGPSATCTVPGAPSPVLLPGTAPAPGSSSLGTLPPMAPPGLLSPARRGRLPGN